MSRSILLNLLKGALIGAGAILPGISGGVLCVALGVYALMMTFLAHPLREFRSGWKQLLPLGVGFLLGVLVLSRLVELLFSTNQFPAIWLFIGLIAGTLPALWRESGRQGRKPASLAAGGIAFVAMLGVLFFLQRGDGLQVTPTFWTWLLCGVLWGIGFLAPGMSPSSLFIFMGVYAPMSAGIADLSLPILAPMGLGLVLCVLLLSRGMNWLLAHCFGPTMHVLLGVSLASTLMIVPLGAAPWQDTLLYGACFLLGLGVALWMERTSARMEAAGRKG